MHPLDSAFLKLRRAKEHFEIAHDTIKGLQKNNIYGFAKGIEGKGNARQYVVRFKLPNRS
jgi:hypothetical protein